jgi:NTP pyrophosphatase (non-canonical NTP hydrolase)
MNSIEKEVLLITQEECAEVVQAISKCFRFGLEDTYNGKTNRESLVLELGDLQCMIDLIKESKLVSTNELNEAVRSKRERLQKWSNIFRQNAA